MEIKSLLNQLFESNNPNKSYVMIETLILKILKKHLEMSNKELQTNIVYKGKQKLRVEFDAYAPTGFEQYEGGTIFEIKMYRNKSTLHKNLQNIYYQLTSTSKLAEIEIKNSIIIVTIELSLSEKIKIENDLNQVNDLNNASDIKFYLWDINDIKILFDNYPELVLETMDNISQLVLNAQLSESIKNAEETIADLRDIHIETLKTHFRSDDLVLFLGAGISKDAKISMWDDLVSDLLVSLLGAKLKEFHVNLSDIERDFIVDLLKKSNGSSPLLMARYIRKGLEDIFTDILTEILYKNCIDSSELLTEITKLCKPVRNGVGIRGVVTYNFDDLLEFNFTKNDIKHRAIFREAEIPSKEELGIYHVHGFLPRESTNYESLSKSLLVFSEEGYHNLMLDPYNWSNLVQLNYLRENTCLLIGLSLTDPNLRRLLDIAVRKQESDLCKHYVILKRELYSKKKINDSNIDAKNIEKFDIVNHKLQEEYYKELGLNVIWVDDFKEIPTILKRIRN
ncbi:SIR2 family protein [Paenibacillus chitinolyticus]|uniref:SIR2 family protein n=1 Tax=Paenibacillus chitinolyticus TaxID=79263 RepID=UPI00366E7FD6